MSREIKFRVYKAGEGMLYNGITCYASFDDNGTINNLGEIMQYTGLKDKNNKEIFEGDIIKIPDDYDIYGMFAGEIYEIYFAYGGFRLKPRDSKRRGNWLEDEKELEVIGNIYENKDLLPVS